MHRRPSEEYNATIALSPEAGPSQTKVKSSYGTDRTRKEKEEPKMQFSEPL
jgi:hypothetical protein